MRSPKAPLAARVFAAVGWLLAMVGVVGAITLRVTDPVPFADNTFGLADGGLVSIEFLGLMFASVGALLVVRRPGNAIGWCMVLIGTSYALSALAAAVTSSAMADGPAGATTASVAAWTAVVCTTVGGLVFFLGLIFPTGRGHTPAWDRAIVLSAIASPFVLSVLFLFRPGPLHLWPTIDNPFGFGPDLRPIFGTQASLSIAGSALVALPIVGWSIASRYRMSDMAGRQQLKWFIFAIMAALAAVTLTVIGSLASNEPPEAGLALFGFAGALVPVAIGIAILRHHLYDIDRLISRTLGYAIISGVLTVVFVAVILVLTSLLARFSQDQTIAVAASTLAVFALFQPVRRRVQRAVDRRFDRVGFDAEQTVRALSGRLRNDIDLSTVTGDVVEAAVVAVHPASASVWLRNSGPIRGQPDATVRPM